MTNDFVESRNRGFTSEWPVAPDYRIVDGHICPLVDRTFIPPGSFKGCRPYLPMNRPGLPGELAKLASGRECDVLDFVRRYGLLGYGQAWRIEELIGARVLEGGHEEGDPPLRGDPLPWVFAHAQTVQLVLDLMGRLDDDAALRVFLATLKVQDGRSEHYVYRAAQRGYLYPKEWRSEQRDQQPRDVALHIIEILLNQNLTGVSRVLLVEHQDNGHQGFTSLFEPRNLLDAVYWHLTDAAIGGWVRRCANPRCGAFFVATSKKVKYCPPPKGYYSESDEREPVSACMNRYKQQVHRDRTPAKRTRRKAKQKRHSTRKGRKR